MQVLLWVVALSLVFAAAAMGVIAWRTARGVRERESARVELLRTLALSASAVPVSGPSISDWTAEFVSEKEAAPAVDTYEPAAAPIFAERAQPVTALPRWISLSAVGAAMALGVTLYAGLAGAPGLASATTSVDPAAPAVPARTTAVRGRPIELIELQYRFANANAFEVSGLVRNPAGGPGLRQLVAVVDLLDADGRLLTSQVTAVERPLLEAGQTSAFSLVFPRVTGTVARCYVQFRLPGRDTVPHVDRRVPEPGAKAPTS